MDTIHAEYAIHNPLEKQSAMSYNGQRMREMNYYFDDNRNQRIGRRCAWVILSIGLLATGMLSYLVVSGRLLQMWIG